MFMFKYKIFLKLYGSLKKLNDIVTIQRTSFELRVGPDYNRFKQKAPSGPPLLELLGMDLFRSRSKIDNIASKVAFPAAWTLIDHAGLENKSNTPPFFIVNVQMPLELSTNLLSLFDNITDGPGFSIVFYYR